MKLSVCLVKSLCFPRLRPESPVSASEALKRQGWTAKEVGVTTVDPMLDSAPSYQGPLKIFKVYDGFAKAKTNYWIIEWDYYIMG